MGDGVIDVDRMTVDTPSGPVSPSRQVFALCIYLAHRPGHIKTRAQIMDRLRRDEGYSDRSVDSIVKRARAMGITQIVTKYGVGYCWADTKPA